MNISGKKAIVFGGTSGIGLSTTKILSEKGASKIIAISRNPEKVTKESALKWLNDPKRRKAKFYSFLEFTTDASIENLKEIYETELSS